MDQNTLLAILVIVVLLAAIAIWLFVSRRRTDHLRGRFGEEYDRTLDDAGDRTAAEKALAEREERVDKLHIRALSDEERTRFAGEWREVKGVFVDSPAEAVLHADRMLATMMKTVGYPMADFDRRYEDLTVDHPDVAGHYREGHAIAERHGAGNASTEDMRQAMRHYEALYDHLCAPGEHTGADGHAGGDGHATTRVANTDGNGYESTVRRDTDGDGRVETTRI